MRKLPALTLAAALMLSLAACGSDADKPSSSPSASQQSHSATESAAATDATKVSKAQASQAKDATVASGDQTALKGMTFSADKGGKSQPKTAFAYPANKKATTGAALLNEGKGEQLKQDKLIDLRIAQYDAKTGKELAPGNWATKQQVELNDKTFPKPLDDVLAVMKKAKVGSDVGVFISAKDAGGQQGEGQAQVWVMRAEAQSNPPKKASAGEVKKLKDSGSLPTVKFKNKKPTITIPKGKDAPADLIVDVIKEGDGKAATETSQVEAKYAGVRWEDGKVFDSSYDRDPQSTPFGLNQVIAGWTQGLTGIKEGSTVLLTIPTKLAYGENAEAQGSPAGPLVFVVELDKVK